MSCGTGAGSEAGARAATAAEIAMGALGVVGGSGGNGRDSCDVVGSCGSGVLEVAGGSMDRVDCTIIHGSGLRSIPKTHDITFVTSLYMIGCILVSSG
jgi:hypothetical protein